MENYEQYAKSYTNGEWVAGGSDRSFDNVNPYNDEVIASIPLATKQQLEQAFEAAKHAQKSWAKTPADERKVYIEKAIEYFKDNKDEIVLMLSKDTGGSVLKANVEFGLTMEILEESLNYVHELEHVHEVSNHVPGKKSKIYRTPLGVVASISPFNFPMNLSMRSIIPAIALGNTVVHKPDIQVAFSGGVMIAKAFDYAGLPKGVFNMLLTDIEEIGNGMIDHPLAELVSFTGSTAVGKKIGETAGRNLKKVALELGGNSPFVVLEDADVDQAVNAAIFGKFIHQGQICMIINRMIIHDAVYDSFVEKFVERAKKIPYGDQTNPETIIGPIINKDQLKKVNALIEQGKKEGATLALEGEQIGNVITPYVFTDVQNDSELAQSEVFGPVATMIRAKSDEEAISLANDTSYGLSSAIFTSDFERAETLALELDAGMTHINDQTVNDAPNVPFGGNKASGLGRFGNPWVVEEYTNPKWVTVQEETRKYPF
ncbi:aldehyde dehydrogenase [Geomicrobium sp. JCM 19037]|uniref:aldehyde dehydrogenase family protein n=1 Tax=unclassified Geomicrobium TaxID=2628951 RepID=UPI00045F3FCF|nr:aldehyde dehydrogenase family protein [Geomicrobium sp. JCM 19037]GAK05534.1 aldehyde dehydrogenase [Geomicrobium sp. JCM 19037]